MKLAGLSLEQAPPLSVPLRFFLTAPFFGVLVAIVMFFSTEQHNLLHRWLPITLASAHLVVLGFITTVMFGAIQQMIPVVAGVSLPKPRWHGGIIHLLWTLGTIVFFIGLWRSSDVAKLAALILLGTSGFWFVGYILLALGWNSQQGPTVRAIQFAVISLGVTLGLGVLLMAGHLQWIPLYRPMLTNIHLGWGWLGWIGFLVIGVAYQVVPMFHLTPSYPAWTKHLIPVLASLLLGYSAATLLSWREIGPWTGWPWVIQFCELGLGAGFASFAIITLRLQSRRTRKIRDISLWFWRLAMLSLLTAVVLWCGRIWFVAWFVSPMFLLLPSVFFLMGFVFSVILGMMLKIVGFLAWFHLQGLQTSRMMQGLPSVPIPHGKEWLSDSNLLMVWCSTFVTLVCFVLMLWWPNWFYFVGAFALLITFVSTAQLVWNAWRNYKIFANLMTTDP